MQATCNPVLYYTVVSLDHPPPKKLPNTACMAVYLYASKLDLCRLQCARHVSSTGQALLLLHPERGVPAANIINIFEGRNIWDAKAEGLPSGCVDGQGPRDSRVDVCCWCRRYDRVEG